MIPSASYRGYTSPRFPIFGHIRFASLLRLLSTRQFRSNKLACVWASQRMSERRVPQSQWTSHVLSKKQPSEDLGADSFDTLDTQCCQNHQAHRLEQFGFTVSHPPKDSIWRFSQEQSKNVRQ